MPCYEITPKSECSLIEMKTIPWNQNVSAYVAGLMVLFVFSFVCVCSSEVHIFMEIIKIWYVHQNIYCVNIHPIAKKKSKASSMYVLLLIFIKCILSLWLSESWFGINLTSADNYHNWRNSKYKFNFKYVKWFGHIKFNDTSLM